MIEIEKKLLLTKDEYDCLFSHFCKDKPIVRQINYYYDTEELSMNRQNITCRIRLKDGKYQGMIKRHSSNSDQSTETQIDVSKGLYDNIFVDMGLKLQGKLTTERCTILNDTACDAVLDKNDYLGYTDYELEIEYAPGYESYAVSTLKTIADMLIHHNSSINDIVQRTCNVKSKSKRFFEKINNKFNYDTSCHH